MLAGAARRREATPPPYTIPSAAPYNAPQSITTPTYDGSGQTVHLDVIDFAQESVPGGVWNGWRFWLVHTPYPYSADANENPSILVSQNGWQWTTPAGLINPVYWPLPGGSASYNSDPDICYDPASDEVVLMFRDNNFDFVTARSADGITWPAAAQEIDWTPPNQLHVSPSLLRDADGTWHMWITQGHYTATAPEGPWALDAGAQTPLAPGTWHGNVAHAPEGGYLGLSHISPGNYLMCTRLNTSGVAETAATPAIVAREGMWDASLYRPALTLHEDGDKMRVWYSGQNAYKVWRTGYTEVPLTEWPAPPAT